MKSLQIILLVTSVLSLTLCLTEDQKIYENIKKQFESADENKNRIISLKEMINSFEELTNAGFGKDKLQKLTKEMFAEYDKNDNGMDWDEFLGMSMTRVEKQKQQAQRRRLDPPELDSI